MTRKFEAHITMPREDQQIVKACTVSRGLGAWSFSVIDGDAIMGQNPYCYLTQYCVDQKEMYAQVKAAVAVLSDEGATVLREKIEEIIYDTKTGHDVLSFATPRDTARDAADADALDACRKIIEKRQAMLQRLAE